MIQKRDALKKIAVSALSISAAGVFSACSERKAEFRGIDAKMKRTAWRPTAKGELSNQETLVFSAVLCAAGSALL